jgi:hypothetical protein
VVTKTTVVPEATVMVDPGATPFRADTKYAAPRPDPLEGSTVKVSRERVSAPRKH